MRDRDRTKETNTQREKETRATTQQREREREEEKLNFLEEEDPDPNIWNTALRSVRGERETNPRRANGQARRSLSEKRGQKGETKHNVGEERDRQAHSCASGTHRVREV